MSTSSARTRFRAYLNRIFFRQLVRREQANRLGLELLESRDLPSLLIVPTFASNITTDPNAATIEATINTAIHNIDAAIANSVTVDITFQEMSSGLGESSFSYDTVSYSSYRAKLASHATSAADMTALASLPTGTANPVDSSSSINIQVANAVALGLGSGTASGTVSLNTSICNLSRTNIDPTKFDLLAVTAHEIDEVLAFGSALNGSSNGSPAPTGAVWGDDLYRYSSSGVRSFDTNAGSNAYFSIDGGVTNLAQFNQQQGGDFSDWVGGDNPPRVQDAYATAGASPNLGIELTRLDVLGFTLATDSITTQPSNQSIDAGQNVSFTAGTSNPSGTDTVHWQVNTGSGFTNLSDGGVYSGSSTTTLTITGATAAMSGYQYEAVFTNSAGSLTSSAATLTVNVVTTTSITPNPAGPLRPNEPTTFMATVTGSPSVGTVTFYAGPGLTNEIGSPVSVLGGAATAAPDTGLAAGSYTITAVYSGGTGFVGSQGTLSITVDAPPTLAGLPVVNGSNAATNIVSATGNGTTATITTDPGAPGPHGFWVGELVTLTGVTPGGPGGLAGTVTVTGVPSATSFQFASTYSGTEALSGATVTAALAGAQRSMVDSIVYNFSEPVTLTAAAFSINGIVDNATTGNMVGVAPTLNVAPVPFTNEWVVTFTDPTNNSVIGNSIANGAYSISINPALVSAVSDGQNLSAGETDTFYRLYGDATGVQSVKNVDANAFNRAWGNFYYSANFNAALDYNDDGKYTNIDANAFNRAFNTRYSVVTTI